MARPPAPLGEIRGDDADGAIFAATPYAAFTVPFNVTGQPAMSVPLHWSDTGSTVLPIGVQLVAATGREDLLLRRRRAARSGTPVGRPPRVPPVARLTRRLRAAPRVSGRSPAASPPAIQSARARVVATAACSCGHDEERAVDDRVAHRVGHHLGRDARRR